MIDIARVRADTPGCHDVIHLNNAGSSLPPRQVVDAQTDYLRQEARQGGYELAAQSGDRLEALYASAARLIGAQPEEIAITSNATESWQLAFASIEVGPGDRILTAEAEYASNYVQYLHTAARTGAVVETIPSDETGQTDPSALEDMIDDRVKLVAISHIPTNGGLINPAEQIGAITTAAGIPFLLDACQSVGQIALDVEAMGCDLLTATGRKYLRGPRGTGFLYAGRRFLEQSSPAFLDLHGATVTGPGTYEIRQDARRYENWEFSYASLIGLGMAVDYAEQLGSAAIEKRVCDLGELLRSGLAQIPGISVHDLGKRKGGIVTFSHESIAAQEISRQLSEARINTSVSGPASTPIDAHRRRLPEMVRASVHYFNTEDELDRSLSEVASIVGA